MMRAIYKSNLGLMLVMLVLIATSVLVSCGKQERQMSDEGLAQAKLSAQSASADVASDEGMGETDATTATPTQAQLSSSATTFTDKSRQFIRKASARFQVKDVYQATNAIEDIVAVQGGFIENNQISSNELKTQEFAIGNNKLLALTEYTVEGNLTVRVPSDKTQDFLRALIGQIVFLDSREMTAHDAQLELLRQQLEYLRNQQAGQALGSVAHTGKAGERVDAITAQSGSIAARNEALLARKALEDDIAFSRIELSLYQLDQVKRSEKTDVDAVFRSNRPLFIYRLGHSLNVGWQLLLDFFVQAVILWPLWLIVCVSVVLFSRYKRKSAAKK